MVKVTKVITNPITMKAKVDLEADTKEEMANITKDDIVGFPEAYDIDFMSSCFTANGQLGFYQSDGTWNWGNS